MADLLEQLQELATASGHQQSRKEKANQRHVFREIVQTVQV